MLNEFIMFFFYIEHFEGSAGRADLHVYKMTFNNPFSPTRELIDVEKVKIMQVTRLHQICDCWQSKSTCILYCFLLTFYICHQLKKLRFAVHLDLQVDAMVFVLSPDSDELEALGRSGVNTPKLPQSGIVRYVFMYNRGLQC